MSSKETAQATAELETLSIPGLSGIAKTVDGLISKGVGVGEIAEHVLSFVSPATAAEIGSLVTVLQAVQTMLQKVE